MTTIVGRDWKLREKPLCRPPVEIENPRLTAAWAWPAGRAKARRVNAASVRSSARFMVLLLGMGTEPALEPSPNRRALCRSTSDFIPLDTPLRGPVRHVTELPRLAMFGS